jgi:hypothetical protein
MPGRGQDGRPRPCLSPSQPPGDVPSHGDHISQVALLPLWQ